MSKQKIAEDQKNKFSNFITLFRFENLALLVLSLVLLSKVNGSLWLLLATFLLFDISAAGYLVNNKFGALTYNMVHNLFIPVVTIAAGSAYDTRWAIILGCYWLFHVSLDRTLGYGMKHSHSFNDTHLGAIGKQK